MTSFSEPTTDTRTAELPEFPMARDAGCPFDPPPTLHELQTETPISRVRIWNGSSPWLITRHQDQRTVLADPRLSSDTTNPSYPFESPVVAESTTQASRGEAVADSAQPAAPITSINMDDPEHARQRRMVTAAFAIRRVEAMRPAVQEIVDDLIDGMLAGPNPVDLVEAFALPVPSLVICELLGVPYADHDFFQSHSTRLAQRTTTPEQAVETFGALATSTSWSATSSRTRKTTCRPP